MKKIGILTYYFANNYGAVLQAYALEKILEKEGIDVELIPFCNKIQENNNAVWQTGSIKSMLYNIVRLPFLRSRKIRCSKFDEFRKSFFHISLPRIYDEESMISLDYDTIIIGSDQVWNPNTPDFDKVYYTAMERYNNVTTYGVSIGNADKDELRPYMKYISLHSGITVREKSAVKILHEAGYDGDICSVLDPTLLLPEDCWKKMTEPEKQKKERYVLCYFLGRKNQKYFSKKAREIARSLGCSIKYICVNYGFQAYQRNTMKDVGPMDFLRLIRNAEMVCTNSFHGTAFSIIFKVPFYCFTTQSLRERDTRMENLLTELGVEERLIDVEKKVNILPKAIDFRKVYSFLEQKRAESMLAIKTIEN